MVTVATRISKYSERVALLGLFVLLRYSEHVAERQPLQVGRRGVCVARACIHAFVYSCQPVDVWVVMLKFNPVFYVLVYIYGMLAALLFLKYREQPPLVFRAGATIAYASMCVITLIRAVKVCVCVCVRVCVCACVCGCRVCKPRRSRALP